MSLSSLVRPGVFRGASVFLLACCFSVAALPVTGRAEDAAPAPAAPATNSAPAQDPTDLTQYKTADELWAYISKLPKLMNGDQDKLIAAGKLAVADMIKRFPESDKFWNARLLEVQILSMKDFSLKETSAKYEELGNDKAAPEKVKMQARFRGLATLLAAASEANDIKMLADFEAKVEDLQKTNPPEGVVARLRKGQLEALMELDDAKALELAKKLTESKDAAVKDIGEKFVSQAELKMKPLDLKFTDIDGKEVDLAKLRGKVVLIDFWATWCAPCVAEVPNVVAAYEKLNGKGFEIIGISLDKKKAEVTEFIKANKMTWPQFCDEKGWKNEISTRFAISSIPAMWLINKQGVVSTTNAREDLVEKVEKLLAEPYTPAAPAQAPK